jgi:hypothetical protein
MIGTTVLIENYRFKNDKKQLIFKGNVIIKDKILTNMAMYSNSPIMNNASFEVYLGEFVDKEALDLDSDFILFEPSEIIKIAEL